MGNDKAVKITDYSIVKIVTLGGIKDETCLDGKKNYITFRRIHKQYWWKSKTNTGHKRGLKE